MAVVRSSRRYLAVSRHLFLSLLTAGLCLAGEDLDAGEVVFPSSSTQETPAAGLTKATVMPGYYDAYVRGLGHLLSSLHDPGHRYSHALTSDPPYEGGQGPAADIEGLFAFVSTMERLSEALGGRGDAAGGSGQPEGVHDAPQTEPDARVSQEDAALGGSGDAAGGSGQPEGVQDARQTEPDARVSQEDARQTEPDARVSQEDAALGNQTASLASLRRAVQKLSRVFEEHFPKSQPVSQPGSQAGTQPGSPDGLASLARRLQAVAKAHTDHPTVFSDQHHTALLLQVAQRLHSLAHLPPPPHTSSTPTTATTTTATTTTATTTTTPATTTTTPATTTTTSTTTTKRRDKYLPCNAPFQEIAYRMCILQETRRKLAWSEARSFCWSHGADLAQEAVVIKARRYLDDQYGEEGTRVRWPMWVGGKQKAVKEGGPSGWQWVGDGSSVPSFLWSQDQPRQYPRHRAPEGLCMYLDGYNRFYGASLPCHLKRRFVCQRRD